MVIQDTAPEFAGGYIFTISGMIEAADNETHIIGRVPVDCATIGVMFDSEGALGASLSADLLNAGASGTGTTVIQASSDNLNGVEYQAVVTNLAAGTYLGLLVDNLASGVTVRCQVDLRALA